jgi:hypothetical protein
LQPLTEAASPCVSSLTRLCRVPSQPLTRVQATISEKCLKGERDPDSHPAGTTATMWRKPAAAMIDTVLPCPERNSRSFGVTVTNERNLFSCYPIVLLQVPFPSSASAANTTSGSISTSARSGRHLVEEFLLCSAAVDRRSSFIQSMPGRPEYHPIQFHRVE